MSYYEKILKTILFVTPFLVFLGIILVSPTNFGLCEVNDFECGMQYRPYENISAFSSLISGISFFFAMILLNRLKNYRVYLAWRKFALIYLPIVAVLILLSPSSGGSGFNPGVGFDSESLTFFFSGLFVFISIILIITKSFSLRGK